MIIRRATSADLPRILELCDIARRFMRSKGNMTQWVNGYPSAEVIMKDIDAGNSYVGVDDDNEIILTFAFIVGEDPTYNVITDGEWLNNLPYGTIHRMASAGKRGGMLKAAVKFCQQQVSELRLDTHIDNTPMLDAARRLGFIRCGIINCQDGTPREAFQLTNA